MHHKVHHEIELDACLQGLGARWGNRVYTVKPPADYTNMGIVHYEMLNIMVVLRT